MPSNHMTNLFSFKKDVGFTNSPRGAYSIKVSVPERAIMELLSLVPKEESFEGAAYLMEGLGTLRPTLVQTLLEHCRFVKVKRLFMFLAEENNHPWGKKQVKIEPNIVLRGKVYPCELRPLSKKAADLFELSVSINTLSVADLYGGKICAAIRPNRLDFEICEKDLENFSFPSERPDTLL